MLSRHQLLIILQEKYERHIRSVSPEALTGDDSTSDEKEDVFVLPTREGGGVVTVDMQSPNMKAETSLNNKKQIFLSDSDTVFLSEHPPESSILSLVPEEYNKLAKITAIHAVQRKHQFIVRLIYRLLDKLPLPETEISESPVSTTLSEMTTGSSTIIRQLGRRNIVYQRESLDELLSPEQANELALKIKQNIIEHRTGDLAGNTVTLSQGSNESRTKETPSEHQLKEEHSSFNLTPELQEVLETKERSEEVQLDLSKPSTSHQPLQSAAVQTDGLNLFERILDSIRTFKFEPQDVSAADEIEETNSDDSKNEKKKNKETETHKEKQD